MDQNDDRMVVLPFIRVTRPDGIQLIVATSTIAFVREIQESNTCTIYFDPKGSFTLEVTQNFSYFECALINSGA